MNQPPNQPPNQPTPKSLAELIADDLFTNGAGMVANRLVMETNQHKDAGGWSHSAVVTRINRILNARFIQTHQ